ATVASGEPGEPGEPGGRLARLLQRGGDLRVGAVVVGGEAQGAVTVTVAPRGAVHAVVPPEGAPSLAGARLFVLGEEASAELLGVLAAARTDDERVPTVLVEDEPFVVPALSEATPISVRVLGDYRIEAGGQEIRSGLRAKARELLAFYLLHPEGTTLDVATEALWPEADAGRGSEWFWTALGNLRSLLRRATGTKDLKIIERDGDRYRIEPVFDVDLWRFEQALPPPGASAGDAEWASGLQAAADLYGGELLAGVDWAWAEVPREDLRRRAVDVLVSVAATRLVAGDARAALDALSRAVEIDPLAEQLYRRIMRLHAGQARVDEVEATYLRLKARLAELDLEPTTESQQLLAELSRPGDAPPSA
ncbi:MAG TPA: bacterial transcriptional activator domain-containing protein, partial [Acidimicrobiales bacterium]|nr:bacterial transcriptional activator domain-containing protein [Acidimicrobiales bacterium]